ncbi:MAG: N-acetyl-gamma-glutamyl-phosphate reductase [Aigarchaeota archaeon]|nr:N-acetyl-gamma-glutamyl-phosphate reductase [Aigarchaeota archaeon]MDW8093317.1 N-acetyl-gamma-glutamyl-phosphate reductase [Nitrososphaerota archaeon]
MTIKVAVIGASGYTGGELLRVLATHGNVELVHATSREYLGKYIGWVHPNLRGFYSNLKFGEVDVDRISDKADIVFTNLPAGASLEIVPRLIEVGMRVIDLGPDFRLRDPEQYQKWYGREHPHRDLLERRVYGLPELHRDRIRGVDLVACPGCNSTATILTLMPVLRDRLVEAGRVAVDVKVGSSEAGRKPAPGSHHPERANVMRPYEAEGHRHVAEVEQELIEFAGDGLRVAMVPHAVGSVRGVLATAHVWLNEGVEEQTIWRSYARYYGKEPFVRIVRGGVMRYPDPKYVLGSNFCDIGFAVEGRIMRGALFGAIDNLMKGAAGQAVQCMNIMLGLDEVTGLMSPPISPI